MRKIVLIGVALVAALGTAFLISNWVQSQKRPDVVQRPVAAKEDTAPHILVAARDLPAGTIIQKDHLQWLPWPAKGILGVHIAKKEGADTELYGAVVRQGISDGEPITPRRIVRQGERGFLAAILTRGMRAVSVPINASSGVAGLLFPGDRVDVILTHAISTGRKVSTRASETVLRNVRLLAVDQRTNDQNNQPAVAKTATLEVTPKQAEAITMLTDLGRLSLSLVSLKREVGADFDPDAEPEVLMPELNLASFSPSYTLDNEVSVLLRPPPNVGKTKTKRVFVHRGNAVQSLEFNAAGSLQSASEPPPPAAQPELEPELDEDESLAFLRTN